jgi:diacylglycerol kinase family enzyme
LVTACSKHDDSYKAAFDETWDLVAVAGGDGTVAKAARHMPNRNVPFALLPTGTANNVAHSLDLLGEAEEIAANLQGAPTRPPTSDRSKAMGRTQFHRGCRPRSLRSCDHPLPRAG